MKRISCAFAGIANPPRSFFLRSPAFRGLGDRTPVVWRRSDRHVLPVRTFVASAAPRRMPPIIRPVVPSETLCEFVEDKAQSRSVILKSLSAYVKKHNLQDQNNKRVVRCDEKLKNLFGVDQCTILEMSKYVSPHLRKPEELGGRYVEEAMVLEQEYLKEKEEQGNEDGSKGGSKMKRSRKAASTSKEDQRAGRKLFKPVVLSDELSAICRSQREMPRQEIVKAVWEYIRMNNLQLGQGEPIKCDFLLKKVYNADFIDVRTIMKGIGAHVTKKE